MATTKTIELRTAIPGPRSKEILDRKGRVVADPLSIYLPVVIARGEGATLTDVDGLIECILELARSWGKVNAEQLARRLREQRVTIASTSCIWPTRLRRHSLA